MKPNIVYIENRSDGLSGVARIGRVTFSKSGKRIYYAGRSFQTLNGNGFKANYFDIDTDEDFWISGCKKRGGDRHYPGLIEIDEDMCEEYWTLVRKMPECVSQRTIRCSGKYAS